MKTPIIPDKNKNMRECDMILTDDIQVGLTMAWHGKTLVREVVTQAEAFPGEIQRKPLYVNTGKLQKVPGFEVFISSDTGKVVGKPVADSYQALTNARYWDIVNNSLGGTGAVVESAGTIYNRSRRFITVKLPSDHFTVGHRQFKNRITFIDSIDGSTRLYAINSSVCVVCANTFRAVKGDKSGEFFLEAKHTIGILDKLEGIEKTIAGLVSVQAEFQKAMDIAASEAVNPIQAKNIFAGFLGENAKELSTRARNTVDRMSELFARGAGNRGETALDVFSAATDFYSHESSGGEDKEGFRMKQFISSEYGPAMKRKQDFFRSMFNVNASGQVNGYNRASLDSMAKRGETLLAIPVSKN